MIKSDIVANVSRVAGLPRQKAQESVNTVLNGIRDALENSERVEFRGFGVFTVRDRKRGVGRNPKTGETVIIPEGKTVKFKPSSHLLD